MGDVTALMMDVITEKSGHTITPMAVSVCLTPAAPAPLPLPYPVVGSSIEGIGDSPLRTKVNGVALATVGSVIKTCHGNEPGTLKEVVSLNTTGPCFLVMGAPIVLCELGMMGITGSMCMSNKAPTPGAGGSASAAGGTGGAGGGGGDAGGGGGGGPSGPAGPGGGGGAGGGGSNQGASGPGSSSGPTDQHQCQNGHPVDVVSGYVVDLATDLELPGAIPLVWQRFYSSGRRSDVTATLGPGWAHGFEQRIIVEERTITLREAEGRSIHFARIEPGDSTFHRREQMTLRRDPDGKGYRIDRLTDRRTYTFSPAVDAGPALLRSIRDAHDNAIRLEYEGSRLARVIDTAGREVRVLWSQSRLSRLEVRAEGNLQQWVDFAYSSSGCLTAASDTLGHADEYEYDQFKRMIAATIKTGVRFQYEYEPNTGRCLRTWGPKGLYEVEIRGDQAAHTTYAEGEEPRIYAWNDQGLMTRESTPDGTVLVENAYDEDCFLVARVNGAGEGEQYWYDERGNRIRTVDAAGNVTTVEYENDLPRRRLTADGLVTSFTHDERGELASITYPSGVQYTVTYDDRGRLTGIFGSAGLVWGYEYNAQHDVVAEIDARGARTTFTYDAMGRPTARTDTLGRTTNATYDRLGRRLTVRTPDGAMRSSAYDACGRVIRDTDALGQVTALDHDGMGVLTRLTQPDGQVWTFQYTSTERLKVIKNPRGETYEFQYDEAGRIIVEKPFDGRVLGYRWSDAGRLARIDYPDQSFREFSYDRLGKLIGESSADGVIHCRRDRLGRLLEAVVEGPGQRVVTLLERDELGRVVAETQGDRRLRYAHDPRGRRTTRVMPDGATTHYAYDELDELVSVEHDGHRLVLERDVLGREITRGDAEGRVAIRSAYDRMDRLIEQRAVAPSPGSSVPVVLAQRQWQYDLAGRVKRIDDGRWGATTYAYDRIGQLLEARRGAHREAFAYDAARSLCGALVDLDATGSRERGWEIAPGNLLTRTQAHKYTYDKRGRRTVKLELGNNGPNEGKATSYVWDARDRLREVRLPSGVRVVMTYDALGRRVRKEVIASDGARPRIIEFLWDGDALAADLDSERGVRGFVHAPGTLIPLLQHERGEVFTYVNDHLGMPRELIDPAGLIAWSAAHSAWGVVAETHTDPTSALNRGHKVDSPFRLLGQIHDEETGLCWTRYRCFDPEVGRWCSPDPLGFVGGANLFAFDGSPTTVIDPLGLSAHDPPPERNAAQDKMLSKGEIKKLQDGGIDVHELKGKKNAAQRDLYKDKEGNIYVKRKGGQAKDGTGEDTGLNINDF